MDEMIKGLVAFFSEATADLALKILGAAAMFTLGWFLIKHAMRLFDRFTHHKKLDPGVMSFLSSLLKILLRTILFIMIATYLGVPNTSFIAILSSFGLAVGLALQGSFGNFAGGLMLLSFKPFKVGDYIKSLEVEGTVSSINILYTQLNTFDNKRIVVPNSSLSNGVVTNYSMMPSRRVDVVYNVSADSEMQQVKELMVGAASSHPLVLKEPAPTTRMGSMSGGMMVFTLRCWVKTADFWAVTFDLNEQIKEAFDTAGISIPPPQTHVHMLQMKQQLREQ
ncbi:MAG: mechanosensitive ion channel family protein [Clostridiales bacterium]|nr:mechanosensitive ion channel family protein [Clostridiales bacterium]